MSGAATFVIRRPARDRVAVVVAAPPVARAEVPKVVLSPAEEREALVRRRTIGIRNEVLGEFKKLGVVDLEAR